MNGQRGIPGGAHDLRAPRAAIGKWDVWPVVVTELAKGPVGRFGGEYSLAVIDVPGGTGHIIPYERRGLESLRDDINAVLEASTNE